jgi:ABC-type multidrug transport system ATPase subunit
MKQGSLTESQKKKPLLKFDQVTFGYFKDQNPLLNGVNLEIFPGDRIGLIGDNGCGKSTITKLLLGLYKPTKGQVILFEQIADWENHYPTLGYIGDPSYNSGNLGLPSGISVQEMMDSYKKLVDLSPELDEILETELKLSTFCDRDVANLSKGQRMRVMAFLALAKQPRLLVADEATEGLDIESKNAVLSVVKKCSENGQFGMLWISHRRHEVNQLSNKIYQLTPKKISDNDEKTVGYHLEEIHFEDFTCQIQIESKSANDNQNLALNLTETLEILEEIFADSKLKNCGYHLENINFNHFLNSTNDNQNLALNLTETLEILEEIFADSTVSNFSLSGTRNKKESSN